MRCAASCCPCSSMCRRCEWLSEFWRELVGDLSHHLRLSREFGHVVPGAVARSLPQTRERSSRVRSDMHDPGDDVAVNAIPVQRHSTDVEGAFRSAPPTATPPRPNASSRA